MDPSSAQHHHQEMAASQQTLESILVCTKAQQQQQDKKPKPPAEQALKCPRCDSTNTKFCYYNNYSLTQPRYFCKSCRRYWTKGGTLRNVPVGGGCRKNNKRSSSSSSTSSRKSQENPIIISSLTPLSSSSSYDHNSSDHLSLAIARLQKQTSGKLGFHHDHHDHHDQEFPLMFDGIGGNPSGHGLFDALRNGFLETPNGFHNNIYYENNAIGDNQEMGIIGLPYEELNGGVKQEIFNNNNNLERENVVRENENRVLWGFPWQNINGGDSSSNMVDLDYSGKQSCNGFGSTWHGLLNGSLL